MALRIATRGSTLALTQAGMVAGMLGGAELVEGPPTVSRETSRGSCAGSSGRCWRARPRSGSTPPRTCRGRCRRGWRSPPCRREDPADAWIGAGASLADVPEGARVGTASLRRRAQLLAARPDLRVEELHGNVDTRLRKLAEGELDAIVLAAAGLRRLGREGEIGFALRRKDGAGARTGLAGAAGAGGGRADSGGGSAPSPTAMRELTAERAAVAPLGASCATPIGVHARVAGERMAIEAFVGLPDGSEWLRDRVEGEAANPTGPASSWPSACCRRRPRTARARRGPWMARMMSARPGVVYLVGAGPGDPGLMTARSLDLIACADAIYYDRLIPPGALAGAREDAELVYVGKQPGVASVPQEEIGERLIEAARAGRSVVRLKGGDPFVFGRGGEEGEALRAAGVEFEVVPGITAGVAATAYAGIPVTHRDDASAVAFVTGHEDPEKDETALDWDALAAFPGTLVFYMGVKRLEENAKALIAAGRDPEQPAAAIERGTMEGQRTVTATLRTIHEAVALAEVKAPALIVVGPVVERHEELDWLARRPLHGKRVIVTRARAQASGLAASLRELGAGVVELPAIRIEPRIDAPEVRAAAAAIGLYELVCLTSPNGVRLLFEALAAADLDSRALAGVTVAAIGPGTARALTRHGIVADVVPERFVAEGLIEALKDVDVEGARVLVARAAEARDVLPEHLEKRGAEVDVVALYETVRERPKAETVEAAQGADYVTFTSSSTVTNLAEALGERFPAEARVVSIGPVTSEAIREAGLRVDVEAERHDIDGLLNALLADAASSG